MLTLYIQPYDSLKFDANLNNYQRIDLCLVFSYKTFAEPYFGTVPLISKQTFY